MSQTPKTLTITRRKALAVVLATALGTGGIIMPMTSQAHGDYIPIVQALVAMQQAIGGWFSSFFGDLFATENANTDREIAATAATGDSINQTIIDVRNNEIKTDLEVADDFCLSGGSGEAATKAATEARAGATQSIRSRLSGAMNVSAARPLGQRVELYEAHREFEQDNADLSAALLHKGGTLTEREIRALENHIEFTTPPDIALPPEGAVESPMGKARRLIQMKVEARKSASHYSKQLMLDAQKPSTQAAEILRTLPADLNDPVVQKYLVNAPNGISMDDLMNFEAERRFGNPYWRDTVLKNSASANETMKIVAEQLAFQNWLAVQKYRQDSRIEILLAHLLDEQVEATVSDESAGSLSTSP